MNFKAKKVHRGFTLIELIVAVFIFMIVFLITMAFVNLASGQVKSLRTKRLTADIRNAMDTIAQKMNNANASRSLPTDPDIYGFHAYNDILGIAYKDQSGQEKCTFFRKVDYQIYMEEDLCNNVYSFPSFLSKKQSLTSSAVKITNFVLQGSYLTGGCDDPAPYITITIEAEDAEPRYAEDNKITIQTSYTLDYLTIKKLEPAGCP